MKVTLTVTKAELDIIIRGLSVVLVEENEKSGRSFTGWKATRSFLVAEALEARLERLLKECSHAKDT